MGTPKWFLGCWLEDNPAWTAVDACRGMSACKMCSLVLLFFFSFLLLRFIYLKGRATSLKHWFTFQCLQPVLDWAEARSQPFLSESSMWVAEPKYLVHYPLSARHLSKKLEWKSCSWPELVLHSGYRLSHHSLSHHATCLPPICVCHSLLFRDNK